MSLVDIPINTSSSETSPFAFFIALAKINPIPFAIQSFQTKMPHSGEDSWFQNSPAYTIADDKLSFEIEINVANDGYVDNTGVYIQNTEGEWKTKTYTFREELERLLKEEYKEACLNLRTKWGKGEFNPYYAKTWFKGSVEDLLECITTIESRDEIVEEYKKALIRPYKALIKEMYDKFRIFVPNQNIYSSLSAIFSESTMETFDSLNVNVADNLLNHKEESMEYFFDITNRKEAIKSFRTFVRTNDFTLIQSPIVFKDKHIEAAYYAIRRIAKLLSYKLTDIAKANIFTFDENPFTANACSKNFKTIRDKNPLLRKQIDEIIEASQS